MTRAKLDEALSFIVGLAVDGDTHPSEIIEALEAKANELRADISQSEGNVLSLARGSK